MGVNAQLYAAAYSFPRATLLLPTEQETLDIRAGLEAVQKRQISCLCLELSYYYSVFRLVS
jgi:hypothetical protein